MSWNIKTPGDYINGPLTVVGDVTVGSNAFRVDTVNKRIGVNIANPAAPAHIYASGSDTAAVRMEAAGGRTFDIGSTASGYGAANNFIIYDVTAGAERLRINASGHAGLGVAPSGWSSMLAFQVRGASLACDATIHRGRLLTNAFYDGSNYKYIQTNFGLMYAQNSLDGSHVWLTAPSGSAGNNISTFNQMLGINSNGVVSLFGGNASANGVGIAFPSAQSASTDPNTLDDYEEGTWTPSIIGTTTTGTATYSIQAGRYTKIGNLVTVQLYIAWQDHTGAGNMRVSNLPFQATNESNVFSAVSVGYFHNVAMSAGNVFNGYVINGSQVISLEQYPTGGGQSSPIPVDTAGTFILTASYRV